MAIEKYELAKKMKLKELAIYTGIRSCPRPVEHEGETHYGTHKFMAKPVWVDLEQCRECNYYLAESQRAEEIICCYEEK